MSACITLVGFLINHYIIYVKVTCVKSPDDGIKISQVWIKTDGRSTQYKIKGNTHAKKGEACMKNLGMIQQCLNKNLTTDDTNKLKKM